MSRRTTQCDCLATAASDSGDHFLIADKAIRKPCRPKIVSPLGRLGCRLIAVTPGSWTRLIDLRPETPEQSRHETAACVKTLSERVHSGLCQHRIRCSFIRPESVGNSTDDGNFPEELKFADEVETAVLPVFTAGPTARDRVVTVKSVLPMRESRRPAGDRKT
jgi:hypothetical protein